MMEGVMNTLSRFWIDLAVGRERARQLGDLAWKEGGELVAISFGTFSDEVMDARERWRELVAARDAEYAGVLDAYSRECTSGRKFVMLASLLVAGSAVTYGAAVWLSAIAGDGAGAILARLPELGHQAAIAGLIGVWSAVWAAGSIAHLKGEAGKRKRAAMQELDRKGYPRDPRLDTPNTSVTEAWLEALHEGRPPEAEVVWREGVAAQAVVANLRRRLDQHWVGLVNVPITPTLNVDLLLVGPSGVWVLELGGVASEGESVQQELSAKDLADAEAKRLMRAADQLSALTQLLEEHCPTVDLAFRVAGGTVRYEKAPKDHGKRLDGPEHKGGWEMWRARILGGARDDELDEEDCWQVLDVLARNAAELSEDFEQSSMVLAEEVYERKQAEINNILLLRAGLLRDE
jgi:hypothetical protein